MNKYLVRPTYIIDKNGYKNSVEDLKCDGEHSSGSGSNIDSTQVKALETRVYNLETVNGAINDRIEAAEEVSNEAKTTANAAHSIASGLQEAVGNAESTAVKAQEKALEAYNSLHSLNGDYEALKARVEDLEETDGQASEPIVGKSKMGYVPDFTEFGLSNKHEVYVELGDEGRSLTFDSNTVLGDVVEELMYCTATGITNHHNRLTALENGSGGSASGGSTTHGNCLENQVSIRQFYMVDKNDFIADGVPEEEIPALREQTINMPAAEGIENAYALAKSVKTKINVTILPRLEALESGSGGSSSSGTSGGVTSTEVTEAINTAISPIESRLKSIEVGAHLMDTARLQPYSLLTNEAREVLGLPLTAIEENYTYKYYLTEGLKRAHYGYGESQVNRNKITALNSTVAGHTSSIQSLDTRTGSHTASIGQLENRMTDVELQTTTNKNKIAALEASSGSGGSITHIGDHNLKSDGSTFSFANDETHDVYRFKTLNEVLEVILPIIEDLIARLYNLEYRFDTTEQ